MPERKPRERPHTKAGRTDRGRAHHPRELNACYAYGALDAVSLLKWGLEHQDIESVDQAHAMLENLRLAHTRRIWRA